MLWTRWTHSGEILTSLQTTFTAGCPGRQTEEDADFLTQLHVEFDTADFSEVGTIAPSATFVFRITNYSPLAVAPTGLVKGSLHWEAVGTFTQNNWVASLEEGSALIPEGGEAKLLLTWIPSDRFWESLAFKVKGFGDGDSGIELDFSKVLVEMAHGDDPPRSLGFLPLDTSADIVVRDHNAFRAVRRFVEWRDSKFKDRE